MPSSLPVLSNPSMSTVHVVAIVIRLLLALSLWLLAPSTFTNSEWGHGLSLQQDSCALVTYANLYAYHTKHVMWSPPKVMHHCLDDSHDRRDGLFLVACTLQHRSVCTNEQGLGRPAPGKCDERMSFSLAPNCMG
ncbi:hypothetical protein C8Q73DRAFT_43805 [Cubamyces lactineus]|nr:hypothetical protein C8Q73DRAFT_43805 [Cubamyces lactineus]